MSRIPEVSIITPSYNSYNYIALTIESVLRQTFTNWEMIIVDDCSTDNSLELIQTFLTDTRIKVFVNKINQGVAKTRNRAIESAQGRYIAFLDADDLWSAEKLATQIAFMKFDNYPLSHTAYKKINASGQVISKSIPVSGEVDYDALIKHNEIGCLTAIYDSSQIGKSYFMQVGHEDFVYWLAILKKGVKSYGINHDLAFYRVHNNTVSSNKLKAAKFTWNIYRNVEKINLLKSLYYFSHYAVRSFLKFMN